jgi:hypothetical protein
MSELSQKRTDALKISMSGLPPKADIRRRHLDVRFVPKADISRAFNQLIGERFTSLAADISDNLQRIPRKFACRFLGQVQDDCLNNSGTAIGRVIRGDRIHVEGNCRLGSWVSRQRDKRTIMSDERTARLNQIGFVWRADLGVTSIEP